LAVVRRVVLLGRFSGSDGRFLTLAMFIENVSPRSLFVCVEVSGQYRYQGRSAEWTCDVEVDSG
jgi:hypothetical protein